MIITDMKNRREKAGLTQEHLAQLAGVSLRTICRAESGKGVILTVGKSIDKILKSHSK